MHHRTNVLGAIRIDALAAAQLPGAPIVTGAERCPYADTDEAAAGEARARFRKHGVEPIEPDEPIHALLAPGEQLIAFRRSVALDRRQTSAKEPATDSIKGDLYVTSARLVHVGREVLTFDLDDIEDAALAGERVLLLLRDGLGIALDADRPRLLRVQVAAARAGRMQSPDCSQAALSR